MSATEFCDDDTNYLAWRAAHPDGYVINILRSHNPAAARLHYAKCSTIGQIARRLALTGQYVKVCADELAELEQWANVYVGAPIRPCGTCRPVGDAVQPASAQRAKSAQRAVAPPLPEGRSFIPEPVANSAVVQAWADDYIRFERRPRWQERLRTEIRAQCGQLAPSGGEVLHAGCFGAKHPNADVENIALYYISSFKIMGRNEIRFEHGAAVPPAPDGADYPFCYRYALAPRSGVFSDWRQGRTLASFDWTDLGRFGGEKKAAQVWLALARDRAPDDLMEPAAAQTPFAVKVQVRPPRGRWPVSSDLVKSIFDGVICAFQAHTDTAVLPEVLARLTKHLPVQPEEIEIHLLDRRQAVLGAVPRLVYPYRRGVKWDPTDHLCVAGELLVADPIDSADARFAITGEIVELFR